MNHREEGGRGCERNPALFGHVSSTATLCFGFEHTETIDTIYSPNNNKSGEVHDLGSAFRLGEFAE